MKRRGTIFLLSFIALVILCCSLLFLIVIYGQHINPGGKTLSLYIPTGSTYEQVFDSINSKIKIKNQQIFKFLAEKKKYPSNIKPGRYVISGNTSYVGLLNILRSGRQEPVNVTFNHIRTLSDIAGKVGNQIEADSSRIISFLNETANYQSYGFRKENIISVFIPDTYEFYWNTSAGVFFSRMLKEYRKFWSDERLSKAKKMNLTPVEVSILASIIDDEAAKSVEKPRIAGVYLNRLRKGIPLQADPTIKFALNDFTITRILNKQLKFDSPYNTYKHTGLPPGPIGCPTIEGIDAVLNAEKHDYLFFAAKSDFSGYHNFSRTLEEHNRFAAIYQKELDKRKIFK
jgi:UPF0755 protein